MKTKLTLNLDIGLFYNESMSIQIICNNTEIMPTDKFNVTQKSIELDIEIPTVINIIVGNRLESDIEIDQEGNVLQEKTIFLKSIEIFNTVIDSYKIPRSILEYKDLDGNVLKTNYFYNKNGFATLQINEEDPLIWLLKHQEIW
jgi:hypothetical protein